MRLLIFVAVCQGLVLSAAITVPKTWDETALGEWATPVAGLNQRPGHFSEAEYYRAPVDNLRTYPVYYPGREPAGYWEMLQTVGPRPLIEPRRCETEADWMPPASAYSRSRSIGFCDDRSGSHRRARRVRRFAKSTCEAQPRRHAAGPALGADREGARARPRELR